MNSKKSPESNKLKVLFFLPLLASFYLFVNVAEAQSNDTSTFKEEIQEKAVKAEAIRKKALELEENAIKMQQEAELNEHKFEEIRSTSSGTQRRSRNNGSTSPTYGRAN